MTYTKAQIQDYIDYLNFGVKEGYIDVDEAEDIIKTNDWRQVEYMMDRGDYEAEGGDK